MANLARDNAKKNTLAKSGSDFNYRPEFAPQANNDNGKQDATGQINKKNVIVGAFGKESAAPKNQNELGPAGVNIAGPVKEILENQAFARKPENEEEKEFLENPKTPDRKNYEEEPELENIVETPNFIELEALRQQQEKDQEEQIEKEAKNNFEKNKPGFPYLIFALSVFEYLFVFLLGITAIFFSIVLPPIGFMLGTILYSWKVCTAIFFLTWSYFYESKFLQNYKKIFSRSKKLNSFKQSNKISSLFIKRLMLSFPSIIPIIDFIYPVNLVIVIHAHRSLLGIYRENKKKL